MIIWLDSRYHAGSDSKWRWEAKSFSQKIPSKIHLDCISQKH